MTMIDLLKEVRHRQIQELLIDISCILGSIVLFKEMLSPNWDTFSNLHQYLKIFLLGFLILIIGSDPSKGRK